MSITSPTENIASLMAELASPGTQADPYPVYARMHDLGEAGAMPDGMVVVTGYEACSARPTRQPAAQITRDDARRRPGYPDWRERPALRMMFGSMLMLNPPAHTRLRRLVSRAFTAQRVRGLRGAVERIAAGPARRAGR